MSKSTRKIKRLQKKIDYYEALYNEGLNIVSAAPLTASCRWSSIIEKYYEKYIKYKNKELKLRVKYEFYSK